MTDHEKRIREALEAVPLPHDWEVCQKPANEHWYAGRTIGAADPTDARRIADTCALSAHAEKFATYIAACNPTAIRTLLADLDAVRVKAARYDWLRDEAVLFGHDDGSPSAWAVVGTGYEDCDPIQGSELDATIDAALKGASHD